MSRLVIVVPARGGSRRLPDKNLRVLGGVPLLGWTIGAVRAAGFAETPVLSTDNPAIAEAGRRLGYAVPFLRAAELSRDDTPTLPVVLDALDRTDANVGKPDMVMLLQLTSPFRPAGLLREGFRRLRESPDADSLIAVHPLPVGIEHVYRADGAFLSPPEAETGEAYVPSGALYLARTDMLRRHGSLVGSRCLWLAHGGISALDIDTADDWAMAEAAVAAGAVTPPLLTEGID